ncbi:MAG: sigma-54 dependent transcriptional regulator [candidate division KSB1 bacterium]|nr:sigma-54 dependent transcriptional regulator [candidate division KSB1 bacterium]MDZ7314045.1 sigma-54 dependent transcriptional regulator [candidate division KSB1 bacterium]
MSGRILIVDDEQSLCEMLEADLRRRGFAVTWHTSASAAFTALQSEDCDAVLADLNMPGMSGIELCERIVANRADVPVVVMTAFGSMESAIAAIRAGAYDFIAKPFELDILALILERAVKHRVLQDKVKRLSEAVKQSQRFDELIGDSPPMRELFSQLARIADTESAVLITGESGTGKELAAHALHNRSRRAAGPFVAINCSALPETLLESELFGYKRGAFTDAKSDRKGLFLQADGGTLFLDEIGDMPLTLQPKLLRALEERRIRPLGGDAEQSFDARIIAATNRDLEAAVDEGRFREDLFYRLNVITVEVPPLRARGADILLLAKNFIEHFAARSGKHVIGLSNQAAEKLLGYAWPGNVRELRNAIEHAVALTPYEKLAVEDLPKNIRAYHSSHVLLGSENPTELVSLEEVERRYILHVLKSVGGNQTHAARILGLNRKTLYRKLQQFGVE